MCDNTKASFSSSEVQGFISQLDSIINRMANNSANAKNWLMTLLAAAIAIQWSQNNLDKISWLLVPTVLFMLTDMYYLGMERRFKNMQKNFIKDVREGKDIRNTVYNISKSSKCEQICNTLCAFCSLSIWPFYVIVAGCIVVAKFII